MYDTCVLLAHKQARPSRAPRKQRSCSAYKNCLLCVYLTTPDMMLELDMQPRSR